MLRARVWQAALAGGIGVVTGSQGRIGRRAVLAAAVGLAGVSVPAAAQDPASRRRAAVARVIRVANARLMAPDGRERRLAVGNEVRLGDRIVTGAAGNTRLMFRDDTDFSIGPGADLTIDMFVFDPARGAAGLTVRVAIGAFRFLSGQVADLNPAGFTVASPVAMIGIRGTHVLAIVEPDRTGCIVLLPDPRPGKQGSAMTVTAAGRSVVVDTPTWGTDVIDAVSGPTAPRTWPRARVSQMLALSGP